ncbi:hypothetical protein [uncultured Massilia sp.]|uniref:hypothetical protein n=1 Tax=uncultured Massilia sp. TaxID=169973 RepID=UPI0025F01BEB|nr:hypothetical protein [uncultured Massilia sp.]
MLAAVLAAILAALLVAAVLVGLAPWGAADAPSSAPAAAATAFAPPATPSTGPAPADPARQRERRRLLEAVREAERTYCSYRAASRYPPGARPMAENADQARPNDPVVSTGAMRLDGEGSDDRVRLQASQSRVYLGAGEAVTFTLRAVDEDGRTLPLAVSSAFAQGVTQAGTPEAGRVALAFADDGAGAGAAAATATAAAAASAADTVADDGTFTAVLAPGQGVLARFDGTIRAEVRYAVGGRAGIVQFDVIHTPDLPAAWTGRVRAALEAGALDFYLGLDVRRAGRYVVSGRVDDAHGQPFALLTFDEVLDAGPAEVKLALFGRLVRDGRPALPLTLRDVEGYLLKEDGDPDRIMLPRLQGRVAASVQQDAAGFSTAEWQSEERSRYLAEFARDVARARAGLAAVDPAAPPPPAACVAP